MSNARSRGRQLRVLLTTPNLDTAGMKYVIADLVAGLDRAAIAPSLAVHRRTHTALEAALTPVVDGLEEMPLRIRTRPVGAMMKRAAQLAARLRGRFDLIHSFDYSSEWTEGLVAGMAGIPWIATKTNMSTGGRWRWLRYLLARKIVCLSYAQRSELFGPSAFKGRTVVIPTGVDLARFAPGDGTAMRQRLGIPAAAVVLGCVAHLVPVKGHPELLKAFAQATVGRRDALLVLVGGGPKDYEAELWQLACSLGIAERVRFLEVREDVPDLLHAFDGLVLATRAWGRKEAFGAVLVEAMAAGLPVIATKSGGPEDIVLPGQTGWLVDAVGVAPLVEALKEFMADPERRSRFGRAGRLRAEQSFSKEAMVERYQQLYADVAAQ